MQTEHIIARCVWDHSFDVPTQALALQDFISQWSHTILRQELEACFEALCPTDCAWRLDVLELDLGEIWLDELDEELPRRLSAALREALHNMMLNRQLGIDQESDGKVLEKYASMQEFVSCFLLQGSTPWWYTGHQRPLEVWDQEMAAHAIGMVDMVRELGRHEYVRRRLVWQFGEVRVRHLIHVLEPWHGKAICSWADQLFVIQAQERVPQTQPSEFRRETLVLILTHMLSDRGSLFNAIAFSRGVLQGLAKHYRIDYSSLIAQMYQASLALQARGACDHLFFKVLHALFQSDLAVEEMSGSVTPTTDYWSTLRQMLRHQTRYQQVDGDTLAIDELFSALATEAPDRVASILREEGRQRGVREAIVRHFGQAQLEQLVVALEPTDHVFIISHAEHVQSLGDLQRWDRREVWQVLLAYLLLQHGSHFDRRQLVHHTLQQLCVRHQLDYSMVIDLLVHSVQVQCPHHHRFVLQDILLDLQAHYWRKRRNATRADFAPTKRAAPDLEDTPESRQSYAGERAQTWRAKVFEYLCCAGNVDNNPETSELNSNPIALGHQQTSRPADTHQVQRGDIPLPAFRLITSSNIDHSLVTLLADPELRQLTDQTLALRLLELAGAGNFAHLLTLIERQAAQFCFDFLEHCREWIRMGYLPALLARDIDIQLACTVIQALPGFRSELSAQPVAARSFNVANFWSKWIRILQRELGIDTRALLEQFSYCARHLVTRSDACWKEWVQLVTEGSVLATETLILGRSGQSPATSEHGNPEQNAYASSAPSVGTWSGSQLLRAINLQLQAGSRKAQSGLPPSLRSLRLSSLWQLLGQRSEPVIQKWILAYPEKTLLVRRLAHELSIDSIAESRHSFWPQDLGTPTECLTTWSKVIRNSGEWHGTSAVLEQQLTEMFWAFSFDPTTRSVSPAQLLVRIAQLACYRLDIGLAACVASLGHEVQQGTKTSWRAAYTNLLRRETTDLPNRPGPVDGEVNAVTSMNGTSLVDSHSDSDPLGALTDDTQVSSVQMAQQDLQAHYLQHPRLNVIARQLLSEGRLPTWLKAREPWELGRLLYDLSVQRPSALQKLLREHTQRPASLFRLHHALRFSNLLDAVRLSRSASEIETMQVRRLHQALAQLGLSTADLELARATLFDLSLRTWVERSSGGFVAQRMVSEYVWQLMRAHPATGRLVIQALVKHQHLLPTALRNALLKVQSKQDESPADTSKSNPRGSSDQRSVLRKALKYPHHQTPQAIPMRIHNAGIVILQSYFSMLFSRLDLLDGDSFKTHEGRRRAMHCLQYLATGQDETPEHLLILNKVLCGSPLREPVELSAELSEYEKVTCNSMLQAVIAHWTEVNGCSLDGFRGNWLVRNASLCETAEKWDLIVERRPWDVLLGRFPLSYSVIKLPWMEKAIYVTWPT